MQLPFLNHTVLGIDVSDKTIELVILKKIGTKITEVKHCGVVLEKGLIDKGKIQDSKLLSIAFNKLFKENKINISAEESIIFGLPENQSFVHVFVADKLEEDEEEYYKLAEDELMNVIPMPIDDIVVTYAVTDKINVDKSIKKMVNIVALGADRKVLDNWKEFFKSLGIKNILIAPESIAKIAGLPILNSDSPVCVMDIGELTTSLIICDEQNILSDYSIPIAGEFLTNTIVEKVKLSYEEAENEKQKKGINNENKKIADALILGVKEIAKETKTFLSYIDKQKNIQIKKIYLVGGSSLLEGITDILSEEVKVPVEIKKAMFISDADGVKYIEAVGLAASGLDKKVKQVPFFDDSFGKIKDKKVFSISGSSDDEDELEITPEELEEEKKLKIQKIVLGIIAIFGVIIIILSFWYQSIQNKKKQEEIASKVVNFSVVQPFTIIVPVSVNASAVEGGVSGKLFTDSFAMQGEESEAISFSRTNASREIGKEEKLWNEPVLVTNPVSGVPKSSPLEKNYHISWVIYNDKSVNELIQNKVNDTLLKSGIKFAINNIQNGQGGEFCNLDLQLPRPALFF